MYKPCNGWDKLPTSTGEFTEFLNHQQYEEILISLDHEITSLLLNKKKKYTLTFQKSDIRLQGLGPLGRAGGVS